MLISWDWIAEASADVVAAADEEEEDAEEDEEEEEFSEDVQEHREEGSHWQAVSEGLEVVTTGSELGVGGGDGSTIGTGGEEGALSGWGTWVRLGGTGSE
jgi:hypothetical protein